MPARSAGGRGATRAQRRGVAVFTFGGFPYHVHFAFDGERITEATMCGEGDDSYSLEPDSAVGIIELWGSLGGQIHDETCY